MFGLVIYAESALQSLEQEQRRTETKLRKEARLELSHRGIVPTETEIAKWKARRAQEAAAAELQGGSTSS